MGKVRVLTDVSAERYWTLVAEFEVESLDKFMAMDSSPQMKELEPHHDGLPRPRRPRTPRGLQDRRLSPVCKSRTVLPTRGHKLNRQTIARE